MAPLDGGPTVVVEQLAASLAAIGVEVTVATTDSDGAGGRLPVAPSERRGEVDYRFFRRQLPGTWKLSFALSRWLRANTASFDVVHVHALFSHSTVAACRAARRVAVPYVLSPHGAADPWSLQRRRWKKAPYFRLVEEPNFAGAAAIHATAEAEAAAVTALGFGDRVHVIPLGVEAGPRSIRKSGNETVKLLFLSRLHPKKGIPLLLGALARVRAAGVRAELSIAGEGSASYKQELRDRVQSLGLASSVRFIGQVEGEAKREAFASADVYVLPSYQENFGIAVAEAMSSGLPVIVTDQVGIAPDVREADAGLVVPVDEGALVQAITTLTTNAEAREQAGARAFRFARDRYSWNSAARKFASLYSAIAAAQRSGNQ